MDIGQALSLNIGPSLTQHSSLPLLVLPLLLLCRGVQYYACSADGACVPVQDVQSALELMVSPDAPMYPEVLVLLGMWLALRVAIYFVLRRKTRTRMSLS
jgi:hypothetical protein